MVIFVVILAVPVLLGVIGTILASSCGAEAIVHLSKGRHFVATAIGSFVGVLGLAGVLWGGLLFLDVLSGFTEKGPILGGFIALIVVAPLSGGLLGYQAARLLSSKLNWYTCKSCGARFRSQWVGTQCRLCEVEAVRVADERALSPSSTHIQKS